MPYCGFTKTLEGNLVPRFSAELELLKVSSATFNFTYSFRDEHQSWGLNENGTWTGTVGSVLYGVRYLTFFI